VVHFEYIHLLPYALKRISPKDSPILACAMLPKIELLITSDSEFLKLSLDDIMILSPRDAYERITKEKVQEVDE
jgi:predicted nucleic acid-binding protein